jgi:hypothetical protein
MKPFFEALQVAMQSGASTRLTTMAHNDCIPQACPILEVCLFDFEKNETDPWLGSRVVLSICKDIQSGTYMCAVEVFEKLHADLNGTSQEEIYTYGLDGFFKPTDKFHDLFEDDCVTYVQATELTELVQFAIERAQHIQFTTKPHPIYDTELDEVWVNG